MAVLCHQGWIGGLGTLHQGEAMSSSNLLLTKSVDFQELLGNGKSYKVPPYQRDYSWTEDEWEDLWLDIAEQRKDSASRHYMGAVVVKAESDREFLIIDGQQRIATLTILGLAVIKRLTDLAEEVGGEANAERARALRNRFVGEKDPASLLEISKLTLNDHDNGFFQDYLVQLRAPMNRRSLPESNRKLWDCFSYFLAKVSQDTELTTDGQRIAEILSEVVARRLVFIHITVDDEISAYTVFETLNARGLELTATDLLKNYLFSRLSAQSDLESVQRRWQKLVTTVRQERFSEFLRYHYLTKRKQIRTGRLFKIVRDEVRTQSEVMALLDALESRAELFEALSDASHSLWLDRPEARSSLAVLNLLKVRQMTPLLFAAYERLGPIDFVNVLRTVAIISFRYSIVSRLNTNDLEPVYHMAAKAVLDGKATTARAVFESLSPIYVDDEKFESDFSQLTIPTSGQRKKVVKYILCCLESGLADSREFETDSGTIEHVLPENPTDDWEDYFSRETWDDNIYRLGNLTLLKASANRDAANKSYADKLAFYRESEYQISRAISVLAPEEWTRQLLEKRQREMAKRAKQIWRSPYG